MMIQVVQGSGGGLPIEQTVFVVSLAVPNKLASGSMRHERRAALKHAHKQKHTSICTSQD